MFRNSCNKACVMEDDDTVLGVEWYEEERLKMGGCLHHTADDLKPNNVSF